jgi:hypothetical protein
MLRRRLGLVSRQFRPRQTVGHPKQQPIAQRNVSPMACRRCLSPPLFSIPLVRGWDLDVGAASFNDRPSRLASVGRLVAKSPPGRERAVNAGLLVPLRSGSQPLRRPDRHAHPPLHRMPGRDSAEVLTQSGTERRAGLFCDPALCNPAAGLLVRFSRVATASAKAIPAGKLPSMGRIFVMTD